MVVLLPLVCNVMKCLSGVLRAFGSVLSDLYQLSLGVSNLVLFDLVLASCALLWGRFYVCTKMAMAFA